MRNSGARVVVEGVGSNGCEYMTGGVAVILGSIGANFGAGMTGGMAYLYDPDGVALTNMNLETLVTVPVTVEHWETQLRGLIATHARETESQKAKGILQNWDLELSEFRAGLPEGDAEQARPSHLRGHGRDPGGVTCSQHAGPRRIGARFNRIAKKNHAKTAFVPETGPNHAA